MLVAEPARQLIARIKVNRFPCLRFRRIGAPVDIAPLQVSGLHPERVQDLNRPSNA